MRANRRESAFTITEMLVTITVISVLLAIMVPALGKGVARARSFRCQMALRSISFDFAVFADNELHGDRGTDTKRYGPNRFSLETFMESQYRADEFWPRDQSSRNTLSRSQDHDPMRCPEVHGEVVMRKNTPCRSGGVGPVQNVSYGFNLRLFRSERTDRRGRPTVRESQLTSRILSHGLVPLVWDVHGAQAAKNGVLSIFSAPSLDSRGPYANDRYWFPSGRHSGMGNYALIDGSVHANRAGEVPSGWDWAYQPRR